MKKQLSVIIPCYNASLYIEECLSSILIQADEKVEVILVNDGSTDDTLIKIERLVSKFPLVDTRIINQENKGVSTARNVGIESSSGTWISFLDSDDCYSEDFIQVFNSKIENSDSDLIEFNANISSVAGEREFFCCSFLKSEEATEVNTFSVGGVFSNAKWFSWSRIYKRELFVKNKIRFPNVRNYEDIATIPLCYLHSMKVAKVTDRLVNYRVREGSLSNNKNKNDIDDIIAIMKMYKLKKLSYDKGKVKLLAMVMDKCFRRIRELAVYNNIKITDSQVKNIKSCLLTYRSHYSLKNKIRLRFIRLHIFYSVNMNLDKDK